MDAKGKHLVTHIKKTSVAYKCVHTETRTLWRQKMSLYDKYLYRSYQWNNLSEYSRNYSSNTSTNRIMLQLWKNPCKTKSSSCHSSALFVSISQVIGCEDCLRNDLLCVGWGVKLYSLAHSVISVIQYGSNNILSVLYRHILDKLPQISVPCNGHWPLKVHYYIWYSEEVGRLSMQINLHCTKCNTQGLVCPSQYCSITTHTHLLPMYWISINFQNPPEPDLHP